MGSLPPPLQLWSLAAGHMVAAAIHTAARLGIADVLAGGPKNVEEIAKKTETHALSLRRLLRTLASVGVFTETSGGEYSNSPLSEFLRTNVPGSQRDLCIANSQPDNWRAFAELEHSVRTGKPALEHLTGKTFFEIYSADAYYGPAFQNGMTALSEVQSAAVAGSYDFSRARKLCDVGGGHGHLLGTLLEANANLAGVLFDAPAVIDAARAAPAKKILASRSELVAGDFFASVPAGADAYIMKFILHDWDDEHASKILGNVRKVIPSDGVLLVVDAVIPPGNAPSMNKLMDIQMMATLSGLERTEEEFRTLLSASGFALKRVIPTPSPLSILEASPA